MSLLSETHRTIGNQCSSITVNSYGGALIDFHFNNEGLNPLSFKFSKADMPDNNKNGAPYQGHFVCAGHWGESSEAEKKTGLPNHGHFANMLWNIDGHDVAINMSAISNLEGLKLVRSIEIDPRHAVVAIKETVKNTNPLGRLFNIVQHPTLSQPFLDNATVVNCNAGIGFNQDYSSDPQKYAMCWPLGYCPDHEFYDLRSPDQPYDSLYSYIVDRNSKHGWITAYSPKHQTVIGYLWNRTDYPWIHLWQNWEGDKIRYRGIEFGTAGYHQPFREMIRLPLRIFDEDVCTYLDAGETVSRKYLCFLLKVEQQFSGVKNIEIMNGVIKIVGVEEEKICIITKFDNFL